MSSKTIACSSVSKCFRAYPSTWRRVAHWAGLSDQMLPPSHEKWAVRDVSFELEPGECLGLIGANGAGKSTLLKLLTGTMLPTHGSISIKGRVASILELGIGFNGELTGRENVRLASGLIGFTAAQLGEIEPYVEHFSELADYLDQPVRTYSSGMQARLAFSLVTAIRPDVLFVDEVLSVGDSYFQHKSFARIREFRREGTTIIFVSHGMETIRTLCDRVLLLDRGTVLKDGPPDEVVDYYNALVARKEDAALTMEQKRQRNGWVLTKSGTGEAVLESIRLVDAATGDPVNTATVGQKLVLVSTVSVKRKLPSLVLGYMLRDRTGHLVWGTNTWHTKQVVSDVEEGQVVEYRLPFTCALGPGSYSFTPALVSSDTHLENNYEWSDNAFVFNVLNGNNHVFIGSSWLDAEFQIVNR